MSKEFLAALERIEYEKGIPKEEIMSLIEDAVRRSLEKHYHLSNKYKVNLSRDSGEISAWGLKIVSENVSSPKDEISVEAARKIKPTALPGEELEIPINVDEIARIASQITKKIITQRMREYEKSAVYRKYKNLENSIITGRVFRFIGRKAIVDLGDTEAVLPAAEQIPRQFLKLNSHIKVYIMEIKGDERRFDIILSRARPGFVAELIKEEVPEVKDGIVKVLKVERMPGMRSKVLVKSLDKRVDPVGTCVGMRGGRIKTVINELGGEKIDLINAEFSGGKLIAAALTPARVSPDNVIFDKSAKKAKVKVDVSQKAQAIGADGLNVSLAEKITGCEIEIEEYSEKD
ncbi:MAG: transcription termination factor NusA [Elusimicrobia bacterium]|nr:transcription termination factor NusA [Elusimicrobiota bacterium]